MLNPLIYIMITVNCSNNVDSTIIPNKEKTIILYIVADNSLLDYSHNLFCDIQKHCANKVLENNNVVLFLDSNNESSLYQVAKTGMQKVASYDKLNSVQPQKMYDILSDILRKYPAIENGIIFWSHGTGWLPTGNKTRSFGDDNGESIDIDDISKSIPKKMNYIIFDACYMGCIEVVTELHEMSDYFILSPDIVPSDGIIDALSIDILVGEEPLENRLKKVCKYYANEKNNNKNLPIALVKSSELDNMMQLCSNLTIDNLNEEIYFYPYRTNIIFYDLGSFIYSKKKNQASDIIDNFIVYHTDSIPNNVCLSIFLPNENNLSYHEYYSATKWNLKTNWLRKFGFSSNNSTSLSLKN